MPMVDTRGQLCPKPLIMAKEVFNTLSPGEQMEVLTDNETSLQNLVNFFTALKAIPVTEKHGDGWHVYATKPLSGSSPAVNPESYCQTSTANATDDYVICIKSNCMGHGDDELGKILIRGFINSLAEMKGLPSHIIFYNSGVQLAVKDTDTAQSLLKLEDMGVSIVLCGTCVDYYELKEKIAVGLISNMYHITTLLTQAAKVIVP